MTIAMPRPATVAANCATFTAGGYDTTTEYGVVTTGGSYDVGAYQEQEAFGSEATLPWIASNWTIGKISPTDLTVSVKPEEQNMADETNKRLVIVAIVDPHPDIPVENSAVHLDVAPRLTDQTNQELFMALNIGDVLAKHNKQRVEHLDKQATRAAGRDVFLEPVRIRDLSMAVIPLAVFKE